ncbi:Hypothetical predicted protein [Mytilus galloprovincialis]|uniref:Reverse transcriptase domain-containing protein n=1 Tax=Mytilus galloprovincialis TaxID=29158 RepID=A0A8B6BQI8_MYTGA|nr:Hypothetical predicted protein [Mytilus galloprovincialis]
MGSPAHVINNLVRTWLLTILMNHVLISLTLSLKLLVSTSLLRKEGKIINQKYPGGMKNCTLVVKERNKARNKARHTGGGHDYLLYKEKEKECRNTIKLTQQQYWETFCSGLNNNNNIGQSYNEPFTLNELQDAIADTSDTSPGKDKVTYNDSAIWLCGKNIGYIQRRIQKDLDNIKSWCDKWGFLISPSKTVAIVFSRKKKSEKLLLTLGTKWGANSHSLRNIYIALIRSKIDYGCEVYNSASHSVKKILDRVQSQALRICTGAYKNVATSGLQVEMGDPPYEERRQCLITKSFLNISSHEDNHPTKESLAKKATFLCYSREIKQNKKTIFYCFKRYD